MPEYIIEVKEIWVRGIKVNANSPYEALEALETRGDYCVDDFPEVAFEYSHMSCADDWWVYSVKIGEDGSESRIPISTGEKLRRGHGTCGIQSIKRTGEKDG